MKLDAMGVAALAVAGLAVFAFLKNSRTGGILNGDHERMSGVNALYATNTGQDAGFQEAIEAGWRDIQQNIDKTQPDWWI